MFCLEGENQGGGWPGWEHLLCPCAALESGTQYPAPWHPIRGCRPTEAEMLVHLLLPLSAVTSDTSFSLSSLSSTSFPSSVPFFFLKFIYGCAESSLKLKLQYFGHLIGITDSLEKTLMLGKIEGGRRRGQQRMRWLDCLTDSKDMSLSKLQGVGDGQGGLECCSAWGCKESDTTERLN